MISEELESCLHHAFVGLACANLSQRRARQTCSAHHAIAMHDPGRAVVVQQCGGCGADGVDCLEIAVDV